MNGSDVVTSPRPKSMPGTTNDDLLQRGLGRRRPRSVRSLLVGALAGLFLLALSACGGDDRTIASPGVTVHLGEFFYQPAELTVPRNAAVNVVNDGAVGHSWILKGAGVGTAEVRPGESIIVDLRGVAPGTYAVYCDQVGHTQAGQAGMLTISP